MKKLLTLVFLFIYACGVKGQISQGPVQSGTDGASCVYFMWGPRLIICKGDTSIARLWSPGAGTYSITPVVGLNASDTNNILFFPDTTTVYSIMRSGPTGCISTLLVRITVIDSLTFTLSQDTAICTGRSLRLNASSNLNSSYSWSPASLLYSSTVEDPITKPLTATQTFIVSAAYGGCKKVDSVTISVFPHPKIDAGNDTMICKGKTWQLNGTSDADSIYWMSSPYLSATHILKPWATPPETTLFFLGGKNSTGCTEEVWDTVKLQVVDQPRAFAGNDTSIINNPNFQLHGSGGNFYQWFPATGLSNAAIADPFVNINPSTSQLKYRLRAGISPDCYAEDEIVIRVFNESAIYIPDAFTPDGDGKNDILKPYIPGMKALNSFRIYNRWGQLLFSTSEYGGGWDGKVNGVLQPPSSFVYIIEVTDLNNRRLQKKGSFTLIR